MKLVIGIDINMFKTFLCILLVINFLKIENGNAASSDKELSEFQKEVAQAKMNMNNAKDEFYKTIDEVKNQSDAKVNDLMANFMENVNQLEEEAIHDDVTFMTPTEIADIANRFPGAYKRALDKDLKSMILRVETYCKDGKEQVDAYSKIYEETLEGSKTFTPEELGLLDVLVNKYLLDDLRAYANGESQQVVEDIKSEIKKVVKVGNQRVSGFSEITERMIKDMEEYIDNKV